MTGLVRPRLAKLLATILAAAGFLAVAVATARAAVIYDNIPTPFPAGMNSVPFQAQKTSEFGGEVEFAGSARRNPTVTVGLSSWACQEGTWMSGCVTAPGATFSEEVTLNIYEVGAESAPILPALESVTETFAIPYRPSANATKCTEGKWFRKATANVPFECFTEKAFRIRFDRIPVTLPERAIISVAYDTTSYGPNPVGLKPCDTEPAGCPYDALNVALRGPWEIHPDPSTGSDPLPGDAYIDSENVEEYYESPGGLGTFSISTDGWTGEQPAIEVKARKK